MKYNISVILGIRPDFIRTAKVLKLLKEHPEVNATFISTGQHYDRELKDIFLEEFDLPEPDIVLETAGVTHCQQHSKLIAQLEETLCETGPDVCLFLGDANAVIGSIVPLKMGIPIAHIEAGMRSFDWRMPEERNRVIIDRISDVLYTYHNNYSINLIREGISPSRISCVGNVIVDILDMFKETRENHFDVIKSQFGVEKKNYAVMTMHRNENMSNRALAQNYIRGIDKACELLGISKIILPAMPRLRELNLSYSDRFVITKPLGFTDFCTIENHAKIEFTDSGTNQETAAILGVPAVILRNATERPETFRTGISALAKNPGDVFVVAREVLEAKPKPAFLGDGKASERIVNDLLMRLSRNIFNTMRENPEIDYSVLDHYI